jgi:hypothetical protein
MSETTKHAHHMEINMPHPEPPRPHPAPWRPPHPVTPPQGGKLVYLPLGLNLTGDFSLVATNVAPSGTPDFHSDYQFPPGTVLVPYEEQRTVGEMSAAPTAFPVAATVGLTLSQIVQLLNLAVADGPVIVQIVQAVKAKNLTLVEQLGLQLAPTVLQQVLTILGVSLPAK